MTFTGTRCQWKYYEDVKLSGFKCWKIGNDICPGNIGRYGNLKMFCIPHYPVLNFFFPKVRDRCRKGIPSSIRPRAWQYLCGGHFLKEKNKGVFEDLLKQPGDPRWLDDIRKDLHRQFPMHEMFTDSNGPG
jgi:hypothetical protein